MQKIAWFFRYFYYLSTPHRLLWCGFSALLGIPVLFFESEILAYVYLGFVMLIIGPLYQRALFSRDKKIIALNAI